MVGPRLVVFTAVQITAVLALLLFLVIMHGSWGAQRYAGTAWVVVGAAFIAVARYQLGKSFSIRPEAHELVTTGLYSKIRNPIYVFGALMIVGVILALQKPALWILLIAVVIGQTVRARREARVLEAGFGDAYREYRRTTWF
ncbi:MAG TPA: isoprenylcysteine carboxylmethyltransferase family protein [Candidatus Sulfotelmatobacter sp.]|nr:isoprenylcysteine carboxylmethyltransferase family protein [Candidatus Sulfotelmatobacter sp.]